MQIDAAVLFAVGAAFFFAVADMFARYGVQRANAFVGTVITLAGEIIFFLAVIPFTGLEFPPLSSAYLWISAGGATNPALFLIFYIIGISKIGVSRAAPIKGCSPLFGALTAVLFFGEQPSWFNIVGILLVVGGIALISSSTGGEGRGRRIDILWPIAAGIVAGIGANFWRRGMGSFPDTLAASFVAAAAGILVAGLYALLSGNARKPGDLKWGLKYYTVCGIMGGAGILCYANALQRAEVYRVLPIIQVSPLFAVIFSIVLLRRTEGITWHVPAGALFTVAGAILVTLRHLSP
ncbi:MAG: DMT family transporter [bacterium]|nr:DMT family transporter [bacterium]